MVSDRIDSIEPELPYERRVSDILRWPDRLDWVSSHNVRRRHPIRYIWDGPHKKYSHSIMFLFGPYNRYAQGIFVHEDSNGPPQDNRQLLSDNR